LSQRIPREFIDQLIARTDVVDLIDSYVPLKKNGANFKACCPFHDEKSGSFVVSPAKQIYHCFGCGVGGNVISFIMAYDNCNFIEALELLAKRNNIALPTHADSSNTQATKSKDDLFDVMVEATRFYQLQLKTHAQAQRVKSYLIDRGLSGETAKRYQLGFAPDGWDNLLNHLKQKNFSVASLNEAGLINQKSQDKTYDRFRDRVMFPIRNRQGKVIGFGGRVTDQGEPKYLNSPETPLFYKGRELYGLYELLQAQRNPEYIIIVEGYMDVLALAQQGINCAVATLGTATTEQHIQILSRHCDQIIFCFDGDEAGSKAAWRALTITLPIISADKIVRFIFLPEGEDPDSFVRTNGKEGFLNLCQTSLSLTEFFIKHLAQTLDMSLADHRAKFLKLATPLVKSMSDEDLQRVLCQELASKARIPYQQVLGSMTSLQAATYKPTLSTNTQSPSNLRKAISIAIQWPKLICQPLTPIPQLSYGHELLSQLLEFIKTNPNLSTASILEHWRELPSFKHLTKLAGQPLLITDEEGLAQEFKDALDRICCESVEHKVNELMDKAKKGLLSTGDKQKLYGLLSEQNAATDQ
jgi:DNA primase